MSVQLITKEEEGSEKEVVTSSLGDEGQHAVLVYLLTNGSSR